MVATRRAFSTRSQSANISSAPATWSIPKSLTKSPHSNSSKKSSKTSSRISSQTLNDLSEPEPSELSTPETLSVSWSSSPNGSPLKHTLDPRGSKPPKNINSPQCAGDESLQKIQSDLSPLFPPRKRFRAIENLSCHDRKPASPSACRSSSKALATLCDRLVVQETPRANALAARNAASSGFSNVFTHARHLLKLSSSEVFTTESIIGRTKEFSRIQDFFHARFPEIFISVSDAPSMISSRSGSLYISGPPGTGKTHLMTSILNSKYGIGQTLRQNGIQVTYINCIAITSSTGGPNARGTAGSFLDDELWKKLAECLDITQNSAPAKGRALGFRSLVERCVMSGQCTPCIVVLDEIDFLAASKQSLITSLFSLSHRAPGANFTVIGIANALDLTTRFASVEFSDTSAPLEPTLVHFTPFDSCDMIEIAKQRLGYLCSSYEYVAPNPTWPCSPATKLFMNSTGDEVSTKDSDSVPLFHPAALQLCAKKVSAVTGDLRTFLSVLRKLIEALESNAAQSCEFLQKSSGGQKSVLDTPTKMRKFTRIISTSQLAPDLGTRTADNDWCGLKAKDPCSHLTPITAPKVSPGDVIKFLKSSGALDQPSFNTSEAECFKKLQDLNLHQSLVLVCLCVGWSREQDENSQATYAIGKTKAYEIYRDCLRPSDDFRYGARAMNSFNIGIMPVSESEWTDLIESGLQTRGLIICSSIQPGRLSCPGTPHRSTATTMTSPFKSPSKRKQAPFQRSVLCTPTKPRPSPLNSPRSTCKPSVSCRSPAERNLDDAQICPVHSISVLIRSIQSLSEKVVTENTPDDKPRFSKEILSLLKQLLLAEEKRSKNLKKRKAKEMMMSDHDRLGDQTGIGRRDDCEDEGDEEAVINSRLVTEADEGSCRD